MNFLTITMLSRKKLNTDGVESPCECLPGVGSFLANPGLSKKTTRTELHHENIHGGRFVHWNIGIKPAALGRYNIHHGGFIHGNAGIKPTALRGRNIHHGGSVLMRTARHLTHFKPSFDPFHLVISAFLRGKMNGITAIVEFTWLTSQRLDCG